VRSRRPKWWHICTEGPTEGLERKGLDLHWVHYSTRHDSSITTIIIFDKMAKILEIGTCETSEREFHSNGRYSNPSHFSEHLFWNINPDLSYINRQLSRAQGAPKISKGNSVTHLSIWLLALALKYAERKKQRLYSDETRRSLWNSVPPPHRICN